MEVVYYVTASVDGFIASPEGGLDWLSNFEHAGEDHGYKGFFESVDSLLIGRKTYDQIMEFGDWPYSEKPALLFTQSDPGSCPPQVVPFTQSPRQGLQHLATLGKKRAWLIGGAHLASAFREEGLISEYLISVIPLILGGGIPLFGNDGPLEKLTLLESRSFHSGLAQLHYRRTSEIPHEMPHPEPQA